MNESKNEDKLVDKDNFSPLFNFEKKEIGAHKAPQRTRVSKYREKLSPCARLSNQSEVNLYEKRYRQRIYCEMSQDT